MWPLKKKPRDALPVLPGLLIPYAEVFILAKGGRLKYSLREGGQFFADATRWHPSPPSIDPDWVVLHDAVIAALDSFVATVRDERALVYDREDFVFWLLATDIRTKVSLRLPSGLLSVIESAWPVSDPEKLESSVAFYELRDALRLVHGRLVHGRLPSPPPKSEGEPYER